MSTIKETTAWAVVINGQINPYLIREEQSECIRAGMAWRQRKFPQDSQNNNWGYLEEKGYSCIEVTIKPKEKV